MQFMGYSRPDGSIGMRNCVGIFSTVLCANEVATDIARAVDDAVSFTHNATGYTNTMSIYTTGPVI